MTQPIQEPSTPRRLTSFGFGQDQLFRRPAFDSGVGYPYVFRERESNQTIGAGAVEYIDWDFDDFDEAEGFFTPDDNFTLTITEQGVYDFLCGTKWTAFNSTVMLQVASDAFGWFPALYGKPALYTSGGSPLDTSGALFIHFQARVAAGASATGVITGHENASDRTLEEAFFRIAYRGPWEGAGTGAEADFAFT